MYFEQIHPTNTSQNLSPTLYSQIYFLSFFFFSLIKPFVLLKYSGMCELLLNHFLISKHYLFRENWLSLSQLLKIAPIAPSKGSAIVFNSFTMLAFDMACAYLMQLLCIHMCQSLYTSYDDVFSYSHLKHPPLIFYFLIYSKISEP